MSSSSEPPTIRSLKLSFLTTQTTILSQPIASPSRGWIISNGHARSSNNNNNAASTGAPLPPHVPPRVLDDVLAQVNQLVARHCRRVYPPQASRNVAEQIESLYAEEAERVVVGGVEDAEGGVVRELDLTDDDAIAALPSLWPSERETTTYPMEAKTYADRVADLTSLAAQRAHLRQRVQALRRMHSILAPLNPLTSTTADHDTGGSSGGEGSTNGLQENLVTRNGPVEAELERMRFLLARVAGRVDGLPNGRGQWHGEDEEGVDVEEAGSGERRKGDVEAFLADPSVFPS